MMEVTFPHLQLFKEVQFFPVGMSLDPQRSISGAETVVPTLRGHWMASASFQLVGEADTLEWRSFLAQMEGRIGTTLVPALSRFRPKDRDGHPLPFGDAAGLAHAQTWEHFGFQNTNIERMTVAANAPLRAMQIDVTLGDTTGIRPGQDFSIGDRLHRVQAHWQPDANTHRIMFTPALREAVAAGTKVEIEKPVCRMRFATEQEGAFAESREIGTIVTCNFVEAI
ncbi:hypothetical protein [Paracoccus alkanivorans]|uniref:Uncharacterized protein n=1 Tax=Paracoccus alkanivorans TaxID=2116655 RepID=A0A3M0MIC2_9RHOB|nr:hypothetical protein [Paracoccus alkanivorans]RMC37492.1 hypothetical protein C9E81_01705 [Paracoccus alkanivorans]